MFPANALVRAFETFDAVSAGVADMYHSYDGYFEKKSRALNFYCGVPFGFTANELFAWVRYGGGQELWDTLGGQFNIKPLLCLSTGTQMGGWFNNEITSLDGFKGLRYRMPGLGGEILRRLGAIVVSLPGGEIAPALKSGAIDASEWIGPWLGHGARPAQGGGLLLLPRLPRARHRADARHQQAGVGELRCQRPPADRGFAAGEYARMLAEFNTNNARSLRELRDEGTVKILKFDDALLKAFHELSKDVVAAAGAGDDISKRIYASYQRFRALIMDWSDISERAYLNARKLT